MAKRKLKNRVADQDNSADKQTAKANTARLTVTAVVTLAVFFIYRLLMNTPYFHIAFIAYLVLATAAILGYVIYNRGFSRRGITVEMLPHDWSEDKKREFIEDGERRIKRSRPLLIMVIAFVFTFAIDIIELYTIPLITELLTK